MVDTRYHHPDYGYGKIAYTITEDLVCMLFEKPHMDLTDGDWPEFEYRGPNKRHGIVDLSELSTEEEE